MITPAKIAEWRAVNEGATRGPWHFERFFREGDRPDGVGRYRIFLLGASNPKTNSRDCDWQFNDAAFIALARTALPAALDEIERLRTALTRACVIAEEWIDLGIPDDDAFCARDEVRRLMGLKCSCTEEAGDSRCEMHPTCNGCGAETTDPDALCATCAAADSPKPAEAE